VETGHDIENKTGRQTERHEDHPTSHDERGELSRRATFEVSQICTALVTVLLNKPQERVTPRPRTGTRPRPQSAHLPDDHWQQEAADLQEENSKLKANINAWKEYYQRKSQQRIQEYSRQVQAHIDELTRKLSDSQQSFEDLQRSMLSGRDRFQPTQDSVFKGFMQDLSGAVKSLSRKVKQDSPYAKADLRDLLENRILTENIEEDVWLGTHGNKELIESAIWRWILHSFSASPFQVYGDAGVVASDAWRSLFRPTKDGIPLPSEMGERWKSLTATHLANMQGEDERQKREVLSNACKALLAMLEPLSKPSKGAEAWIGLASKVIKAAATLADNMARQRCRLEFFCPLISQLRKEDLASLQRRKDIADVRTESVGFPLFVVAPGLQKLGDGWAQNLEEASLLVPAFLASEEVD
jgi:hypothetical protein